MASEKPDTSPRWRVGRFFRQKPDINASSSDDEKAVVQASGPAKWSMGVMNDPTTIEVPGSVLLLASHRNEPLGLRNVQARTSHSSIPAGFAVDVPLTPGGTRPLHPPPPGNAVVEPQADPSDGKKKTEDGKIILEPQPEDSANDPLNWPSWRRDVALLSLGFYCMIGGGMTPVIAAGFTDVAEEYHVNVEKVSLTTGLYMMGLGLGSVFASPTAILYGKRPVYLASAIILIGTSVWAAKSPSFGSLLAARVFQGVAISPVECLPSATIAEIFFLHERAFRIGIYTLLLLGGKNLVPLISAAIIGRLGWRWTFWIVAIVVAFASVLLFLFVPETFWDRTPTRKPSKRPNFLRRLSSRHGIHFHRVSTPAPSSMSNAAPVPAAVQPSEDAPQSPGALGRQKNLHVGFASALDSEPAQSGAPSRPSGEIGVGQQDAAHDSHQDISKSRHVGFAPAVDEANQNNGNPRPSHDTERSARPSTSGHVHSPPPRLDAATANGRVPIIELPDITAVDIERTHSLTSPKSALSPTTDHTNANYPYHHKLGGSESYFPHTPNYDSESIPSSRNVAPSNVKPYTYNLRQQPAQSFVQQLRPYHGRLNKDKWLKVMVRPFILFAYPAVLWSSAVYACSIGWLIVISETMAIIYRDPAVYNFSALQTGLVYISPFAGGILGTGVAGKVSDIIVKAMARRNGGLYEPEFRLVMAVPIIITTCIGLMGFGWSAEIKDHWMIPTAFFGIVSFGCSLGSTTSITFCVDSYRQYAGEALVTLNFSKNVIHGFVFSLFVSQWLKTDGAKSVYIWLGVIQLIIMLTTIPLYIFGKRARLWTSRMNLMEKF